MNTWRTAVTTIVRSLPDRVVRSLSHTSPLRLLLLICITILITHSLAMLLIHRHPGIPEWLQSIGESVLLVLLLFPALYIFSFRPLLTQIAETAQAEAIMRESEHKYRQLFESLGDAAFLIDVETGRVIDTNRQAEKILGYERAEILGRKHGCFFPPDKAAELSRLALGGGILAATVFEAELQAIGGRRVPVHVSSAPLTLFGRNLAVCLFRNVAEFRTPRDGN